MNSPSLSSHASSHPALENMACAGRSAVLLLIRLAWGFYMFQSGWGHLQHVAEMTQNFKDWGVPLPHLNVYISGCTEMVGGLLFLFGLFSRVVSVPLVINFIVALLTASRGKVEMLFTHPGAKSWTKIIDDDAFPFLIASLVVLGFGPGKVSIDYLLQRTIFKNRCSARHLVLKTKPLPMRAQDG